MGTRPIIMDTKDPILKTEDRQEEEEHIVKHIEPVINPTMKKTIILVCVVLCSAGIGTGYLLSRTIGPMNTQSSKESAGTINTTTVVGSTDETTFKDSASGTIEKGGLDGEGTHNLVREGGPSQTVYLISSVVDLDEYVGKNVKVWGQTQAAKKAAWLMDVGKIELLNAE
jgi:hypothetical protein